MRMKRVVPAAAFAGALFSLVALPTPAGADDGHEVEVSAHADCVVQVDLYGHGEAEITLIGIPPTGGGELVTDTVSLGDGMVSVTYDLSDALADVEPFLDKGHHVKLTVETEDTYGDDAFHEVFWVEDCVPHEPHEPHEPDEPDQPDVPDEPDMPDVPEDDGGGQTTPPAPAVTGQPTLTG